MATIVFLRTLIRAKTRHVLSEWVTFLQHLYSDNGQVCEVTELQWNAG